MHQIIESNRETSAALCRRFGVRRLELFGSATTNAFDPQRSDLDLLVEFDDDTRLLFDRYFGLKEALESLYGRCVDLVTVGPLKNPYFVEAVNKTRQLLYAAEGAEAA